MPIQPYFPEPLTVSGSVAGAKHRPRVAFVRRVVGLHFVTVVAVVAVALYLPVAVSLANAAALTLAGLVCLSLARRIYPSGRASILLSTLLLAPTLVGLALAVRSLHGLGWPVLGLLPAATGLALYALFCGNDLSYVGQFVLCSALVVVCGVVARYYGLVTWPQAVANVLVAMAYLFYYVYDLSMIVKRRRFGEEVSAVADLYRDLLNFVTYPARVYLHWRKYRFI